MSRRHEPSPDLQKASAFFQQPAWVRLLEAIYKKYMDRGISGQVVLDQCTREEQREIARFLQRSLPATDRLSVRLADFQAALEQSSFACSLPDLLQALFPERPHVTRVQQRTQQTRLHQQFYADLDVLIDTLPADSRGKYWLLHGKHGKDALFRYHKNEARTAQEHLLRILQVIVEALDQLPAPSSFHSLAQFSLRISGDPHFLDATTGSGRLFLSALADLRSLTASEATRRENEGASDVLDQEIQPTEQEHWRHLLYYEAGLLLDTVSSTVAVFHLRSAWNHTEQADPLIGAAGARVLVLPLRQLLAWKKLLPVSKQVYLFENPQVFEILIDTLLQECMASEEHAREKLPTLVCTSGWPSVAVLRLLNLLTESDPETRLYYSGDFDIQGLRIAAHLLARYPRQCRLWHFDPASYLVASHSRGATLDANDLTGLQKLPPPFAELCTCMQQRGQKAYQEGLVQILLEDIHHSL